jgi:NAD-dependent DNA ligase
MKETKKFIELQKELLRHKFLYYVQNTPEISDYDYDILERKSLYLADTLGFNANPFTGPEENEAHHVHWMIGYNENSIYNEG